MATMNNNEPNKIVSRLFKTYLALIKNTGGEYYSKIQGVKKELVDITTCVGAIEVMSKASILKLVKMQSSLRFMDHHSFYIHFAKACEDFTKN
jgi:hypothetical protein